MAEKGEPLSEREMAVLALMADGCTNREIARDLSISHNTVKVHLRNIFSKLDVSSRTEAATLAMQMGLLAITDGPDGPEVVEGQQVSEPSEAANPPGQASHTVANDSATSMTRSDRRQWVGFAALLVIGLVLGVLAAVQILDRIGSGSGPSGQPAEQIETPLGNGQWFVAPSMPRERANMALAAVGLDLYQIGGVMDAGVVNLVDVYETNTGQWHTGAAKPTAVSDATAAVLYGEIYVPGGRLADDRPTSVVEAYSPSNSAWRPVAALPKPLAGGLVLSDGSLLYLFGGWDGEAFLNEVFVYEPSADEWQPLPPMANRRAFATGGVVSGRLYVVGGLNEQGELAACEYYEVQEQSWFSCPDMMQARAGAGATVLTDNQLYVIGGGMESTVSYGEIYDAKSETWRRLEMPMLSEVNSWYDLGVTNVETRIFALGGRQDEEILSANYVYAPLIHRTFLPAVGGD